MTAYPHNDITRDEPLYIRELQTYLRKIGTRCIDIPLVAIDGVFGPETTESVTAFQKKAGLDPNGRVNRKTWDAVVKTYARFLREEAPAEAIRPFPSPQHVIEPGDQGPLVGFLQLMLDTISNRYANIHASSITGTYDADTEEAVRDFQRLGGLEPNGKTDKETWNQIARLYNIQDRDELNP